MNATLKERAIVNRLNIVFIFTMFFSFFISNSFSQDDQQPFDYSRTIWIIDNIGGKGIVYGLPNYEELESDFIIIYNILMKYVRNLENFPDATSANDLTPKHSLVLMNDVAEQQLLIGSNWISDGEKIALMDETDFFTIKNILTQRAKIDTTFTKHPINPLLRGLRKGIQDNPEEFEYRLQLYKNVSTKKLVDIRKTSFSSSSNQAPLTESGSTVSGYSSNTLSSSASDKHTTSNAELVAQSSSNKEITNISTDDNESFNFILRTATILLALLGGFWLIKRSKK